MKIGISEESVEEMKKYIFIALQELPKREMVSKQAYFSAPRIIQEAKHLAYKTHCLELFINENHKDYFSGNRVGGQDLVSLLQDEVNSGEIETAKIVVPQMYRTIGGKRPIRVIIGYRFKAK